MNLVHMKLKIKSGYCDDNENGDVKRNMKTELN